MTDLIDEMFNRVQKIVGLNCDIAIKFADEKQKIRQEFGGEAHYIRGEKRETSKKAVENAMILVSRGVAVSVASKKYGISRARIYQILNKK